MVLLIDWKPSHLEVTRDGKQWGSNLHSHILKVEDDDKL